MKQAICIFCAFVFLITGCSRVTEVDSKSFVTAIGFDKGENYNLRFTFVFTSPTKDNSKDSTAETIVIEAPSLYSAIEQINNFKSKEIQLTHTQTIIFSEELAKDGIEEYIYMLVRSSHFRPNTYVCITDKSSMEFLKKIDPSQSYHLEKYFQLIFNKMTSGKKGDLYLYDAYFRLLSSGGSGVLPYCAINETTIKGISSSSDKSPDDEPTTEPTESETIPGAFMPNTDDFAINTVAGGTVSESKNKAEIQGVGVIKDGKLISLLGRLEALTLQMITNSMPDSYVTISNPSYNDRMITCYVVPDNKTKISVKCSEAPVITIKVTLEGDFIEVGKDNTFIKQPTLFEEYFEEKTEEAARAFLEKTARDLKSDICGFSERAKAQFLTVEEWTAYGWEEKYANASFEVEVNLTIRTYGELSQSVARGR